MQNNMDPAQNMPAKSWASTKAKPTSVSRMEFMFLTRTIRRLHEGRVRQLLQRDEWLLRDVIYLFQIREARSSGEADDRPQAPGS